MENLLKFVGVDIVQGGLIQVEMKDDNNRSYHVFFEPSRFFSQLGWVMYSNYKDWKRTENLIRVLEAGRPAQEKDNPQKFTYTKDE